MNWIDDLEVMMKEHLLEFHYDMEGLTDEVSFFVQHLIYSKFSEDDHIIPCPFVGCAHEIKFSIEYKFEVIYEC